MLVAFCWSTTLAQTLSYEFYPGLRISQTKPPTSRELTELIRELSSFSGLRLKVEVDGAIHYDADVHAVGGSAIARELLMKAIDSGDSIFVESANRSQRIVFAQIESTTTYRIGTQPPQSEWVIRIDFADFAQLRGDAAASKAFTPGLNLMHELTHAIHHLPDPETPKDPLGQCERHLNLMRAELGFALRQNYFPRTRLARSPASLSQILQGEIRFTHPQSKKPEELLLTFDVAMVVDVDRLKSKTSILSELMTQTSAFTKASIGQ